MKRTLAFTLVELLIASVIFVIIVVAIYSVFYSGVFGYGNIEDNIEVYQPAGKILGRINLDLRNAFAYSANVSRFSGESGRVSFLALVDSYQNQTANIAQDYAFISYYLENNAVMRLCRKNQDSLNEASETLAEEMASGIENLTFSYGYLGSDNQTVEFTDSWGIGENQTNTLPLAVSVTLGLTKNKVSQEFRRQIFLP